MAQKLFRMDHSGLDFNARLAQLLIIASDEGEGLKCKISMTCPQL